MVCAIAQNRDKYQPTLMLFNIKIAPINAVSEIKKFASNAFFFV